MTGRELIERAVQLSQSKEGYVLADFLGNRQNTHKPVVEQSVLNSGIALYKRYYETQLKTEKQQDSILEQIKGYIKPPPSPLKEQALSAVDRLVTQFSTPYSSFAKLGYPMNGKMALLLCWLGITDPNALEDQELTDCDIEDRKRAFIRDLGTNPQVCYGGTLNALISSLDRTHRDVTIINDKAKQIDKKMLKKEVNQYVTNKITAVAKKLFNLKEKVEQDNIIKTYEDGGKSGNAANQFLSQAKQMYSEEIDRLKEALTNKYNKIISKQEITELLPDDHEIKLLIEALDYIDITTLISPQEDNIRVDSGQEEQRTSMVEDPSQLDQAEKDITELLPSQEKIQLSMTLDYIQEDRPSPEGTNNNWADSSQGEDKNSVVKDTSQADEALLDHPFTRSICSNTLLIAAQDYKLVVLKCLLELVSVNAVSEAVIQPDSNGNNALMAAARNQTNDGFTALIEKLNETIQGQTALFEACKKVNPHKNNALIFAAVNQTSGGFKTLVEILNETTQGRVALYEACKQVNRYGANVLIRAAQYQTNGGFATLVRKLNETDNGKFTLFKSCRGKDTLRLAVEKQSLADSYSFCSICWNLGIPLTPYQAYIDKNTNLTKDDRQTLKDLFQITSIQTLSNHESNFTQDG
jgi:ankyrin repeat protein